jgi:hypothetical protein
MDLIIYIFANEFKTHHSKCTKMKNIFFTLFTSISVSIIMGAVANAQTVNNATTSSNSSVKDIPAVEVRKADDPGFHYFNEIHARAIREFLKDYQDVQNVKWFKYKKGYVATFVRDSITTRLYYNKRGDFDVQLRYFNENRLPIEVRDLVRNRYYNFSIFQVCEVSGFDKIYYQIKIRDNNFCKVINVVDGEIKVMVKYTDIAQR